MDIRMLDKSLDAHVLQSSEPFSRVYASQHFKSGITTSEAAENVNWMRECTRKPTVSISTSQNGIAGRRLSHRVPSRGYSDRLDGTLRGPPA
jgi:hypothetical protein